MAKITVKNTDLSIVKINEADYISLTDIAKYKTEDTSAVDSDTKSVSVR